MISKDDVAGANAYVAELGWKVDTAAGVIEVPSNPDNTVTSTVVQENIKLPRVFAALFLVLEYSNIALRAIKNNIARHASCLSVVVLKACSKYTSFQATLPSSTVHTRCLVDYEVEECAIIVHC